MGTDVTIVSSPGSLSAAAQETVVTVITQPAEATVITIPGGIKGDKGDQGDQGIQGPPGNGSDALSIRGYPVNLTSPATGQFLSFASGSWVNAAPETLVDGGNF